MTVIYVEQMIHGGVYNNSLIIIVADHGIDYAGDFTEHYQETHDLKDWRYTYENFRRLGQYNISLFAKPPYASGSTEITHDPAWNGDVRAIINYYFSNFKNTPPKEVEASIRAHSPVEVIYSTHAKDYSSNTGSNEHTDLFKLITYINRTVNYPGNWSV